MKATTRQHKRKTSPASGPQGGESADPRGSQKLEWDKFILDLKKTTKEFIENVLETIIESIVVTNIDGRLVFFNRFSEELFGYRAEEVLNHHLSILGGRAPDILSIIRQGKPFSGEIELKTKDQRLFPAHVRCVPLRDEQDRPIAMVGVARDLTREKEKEAADREVARLKAFNENIIASLRDGIQILSLDGIITFANKRQEEMLEYDRGELIGSHYSRLVVNEGVTLFQELIDSKGMVPQKSLFETRLVTRTGRRIPVLVSGSPFVPEAGVTGIVTAVTDVSEVQRLKEELFQSEKLSLIGTLASEVAHEINNPLGGQIIALQMLTEDVQAGNLDPDAILEELAEIEADARRCRKIVQKLLEFSRRVPEEKSLLDMNNLLEEALGLVQRQAELVNVTFSKSYAADLPRVRGLSNDLQQVIINIVKNAQDAMSEGGCIGVSTDRIEDEQGQWVRISISDTGPGIPPDIGVRIFDSFFTTKARHRGTGLGLAVGKRIMHEHGGRIGFENQPEGGAVFRILFPAAAEEEPETLDG